MLLPCFFLPQNISYLSNVHLTRFPLKNENRIIDNITYMSIIPSTKLFRRVQWHLANSHQCKNLMHLNFKSDLLPLICNLIRHGFDVLVGNDEYKNFNRRCIGKKRWNCVCTKNGNNNNRCRWTPKRTGLYQNKDSILKSWPVKIWNKRIKHDGLTFDFRRWALDCVLETHTCIDQTQFYPKLTKNKEWMKFIYLHTKTRREISNFDTALVLVRH